MEYLFNIGILNIEILDIVEILIVGFLIYRIYKLLRGSIAFNIFIGVMLLYVVWWFVGVLKMDLLSLILGQFVNLGVLILIIIFQPEVRRFLLMLGNSTLKGRTNFINRWIGNDWSSSEVNQAQVMSIRTAILQMAKEKTGALIIMGSSMNLQAFSTSGTVLDAEISAPLLLSIFNKDSPLHDGAVIISSNKVHAAGFVLPVSDNPQLPKNAGLRHRAGVGVTENSGVAAFIVSEERGSISYAYEGRLKININQEDLVNYLKKHFT